MSAPMIRLRLSAAAVQCLILLLQEKIENTRTSKEKERYRFLLAAVRLGYDAAKESKYVS